MHTGQRLPTALAATGAQGCPAVAIAPPYQPLNDAQALAVNPLRVEGIREVCKQFVALCRDIDLLDANVVAIDGSKFKAVNA